MLSEQEKEETQKRTREVVKNVFKFIFSNITKLFVIYCSGDNINTLLEFRLFSRHRMDRTVPEDPRCWWVMRGAITYIDVIPRDENLLSTSIDISRFRRTVEMWSSSCTADTGLQLHLFWRIHRRTNSINKRVWNLGAICFCTCNIWSKSEDMQVLCYLVR